MQEIKEKIVDGLRLDRLDAYVSSFEGIFARFGKTDSSGALVVDSFFGNHDQFLVKRSEHIIDGLSMVAIDLYYVLLDNKNKPMLEKMFFSATSYAGVEILSAVEDPNAGEPEDNWIPDEYVNSPEPVMAAILTKAEDKLKRVNEIGAQMQSGPHDWLHPVGNIDAENA